MAAVTITTIAIGAAIGAGVGAVATYASGGRGDALWKGALTGAVGGALTAGVGSWATSAGGLALGNVAGYALGGAVGGMGAGALGTALNGGNSSDYLRNITTGGILGGATGALGGYLQGGSEAATTGVNPVTGEAVSTAAPEITALPDAEGVAGMQTGSTAAPAVQQSITGPSGSTSQGLNINPEAGVVTDAGKTTTYNMTGQTFPTESPTAPAFNTWAANANQSAADLSSVASGGLNINPNTNTVIDGGKATTYNAAGQTFPKESVDSTAFKDWETGVNKTIGDLYKTQTGTTTTGTGTKMTSDAGLANYLKLMGYSQLMGGGVKTLGALATAPETARNRQQLMDLYNEQNNANQYYQNLMQNTYQNPMAYLGSGEAAATRSAALQKALAINAQAGRRTQGGALANQLMQTQLNNLQNYRRGIPQPQYGTAAQTLNYAQQYSPTADIFGGVASMATPLSLYSLFG